MDSTKAYINDLNRWLSNQCNGNWEHENGIEFNTMDNPGWKVTIDIVDTHLEGVVTSFEKRFNETDWLKINSDGQKFIGMCGVFNLKKFNISNIWLYAGCWECWLYNNSRCTS